jgi:hydrogenase maturation protease
MSPGRGESSGGAARPALLVLGLGNLLLGDDAVGLELLAEFESAGPADGFPGTLEFVDGGTQGIALLGVMGGREAMLVLDAVQRGEPPGTVHELTGEEAVALRFRRPETAHEGGAGPLLALAALTGDLPARVRVVGIEPECVETRLGLSPRVRAAVPVAVRRARLAVECLIADVGSARPSTPAPARSVACTS